jgi:glycosyltransferase involved in cell wall biosynthesis
MIANSRRPRIFTWHIHGSYLFYLSQANIDVYIPVTAERTEGYYGRGETFPFGDNVIEVPASDVKELEFDCILFQTNKNFLVDQYEILSPLQRLLPKIYLEHDPPREHPVNESHIVANDEHTTLVHVTHFNRLMWDNNKAPAFVIEHGVTDAGIQYSGDKEKGIVVVNNLPQRGRICGFDIFKEISTQVPMDLIGMGTQEHGLGEVLHPQLPEFISHYRFFFHPIRYTSLGLAVCEAMMLGIPVVGLATTELSTIISNGYNGFVHTDVNLLVRDMNLLLRDKELATEIGLNGRRTALERFGIERFTRDWEKLVHAVIEKPAGSAEQQSKMLQELNSTLQLRPALINGF